MTPPDETDSETIDPRLLERLMACDRAIHASSGGSVRSPAGTDPELADDCGHGRLLLMLSMLDAVEDASEGSGRRGSDSASKGLGVNRPILGRFDVLEQLGSGGFGFVVRARDLTLGREVALKLPLPEGVLRAGDVDRFLKEARATARLDHPSIVRVHDAGALGPFGYYIASEYCPGVSLKRWLKTHATPVPALLAARWLAVLADAVQHAHDRGILHRDIKPDNVIMSAVEHSPTFGGGGGSAGRARANGGLTSRRFRPRLVRSPPRPPLLKRRFAFQQAIFSVVFSCSVRRARSLSSVRRLCASTISPTWASARSGVWPEKR